MVLSQAVFFHCPADKGTEGLALILERTKRAKVTRGGRLSGMATCLYAHFLRDFLKAASPGTAGLGQLSPSQPSRT